MGNIGAASDSLIAQITYQANSLSPSYFARMNFGDRTRSADPFQSSSPTLDADLPLCQPTIPLTGHLLMGIAGLSCKKRHR